jgi:hypothetical protein
MTRNGQEIFVDQGGFSRAPWESKDASLPFTVDTQTFFAAEFDGYLYAPADDVYTFGLPPEERSRLVIGDRIVVGNVALKKGLHSINLQYFHEAGPSELKLEWSRTGDPEMQEIPSTAVYTRVIPVKPELPQLSTYLPGPDCSGTSNRKTSY